MLYLIYLLFAFLVGLAVLSCLAGIVTLLPHL